MMHELAAQFGTVDSEHEFFTRLTHVLSDWEECLEFGIYRLNSTKQKLVAPKVRRNKYKILPDLWLSSTCEQGIDEYAIEMAYDVCYGLMEEGLSTIKIQGLYDAPDIIIVGQFNKESLENADWSAVEMKLSSEYRKALAKASLTAETGSHAQSVFETFQHIDDIQYHRADSKYRHVMIDLSALVNMIKQRHSNRFYWKSFGKEFVFEMTQNLSGQFQIANYGVEGFIISVEKKFVENDFNKLKAFVEDFQFWRYFEDSSVIVAHNVLPEVRLIVPSSVNTLKVIHEGRFDIMEAPERVRQIEV